MGKLMGTNNGYLERPYSWDRKSQIECRPRIVISRIQADSPAVPSPRWGCKNHIVEEKDAQRGHGQNWYSSIPRGSIFIYTILAL